MVDGTWFPVDASGIGLELSEAYGSYRTIDGAVFVTAEFSYPVTSDTNTAYIGGLPFLADVSNFQLTCTAIDGGVSPFIVAGSQIIAFSVKGAKETLARNSDMSGASCRISGFYQLSADQQQ